MNKIEFMLGTCANLNDVVAHVNDLINGAYLRIEQIVSLVRQIDGFRINLGLKRNCIQPHQLRQQILVNLVEAIGKSGEQQSEYLVRLAESVNTLSKQDIESLFKVLVDQLVCISLPFMAGYASALLMLSKKLKYQNLSVLVNSIDELIFNYTNYSIELGRAMGELVCMTRYTFKYDSKFCSELLKKSRLGSPFSILLMCGICSGALRLAIDQHSMDTKALSMFGMTPTFIHDISRVVDCVCRFVDENDEAGILLLLDTINGCTDVDIKVIAFKRLLEKRLARGTVLRELLWPVNEVNHKILGHLPTDIPYRILETNADLLVEIERQDCLAMILSYLSIPDLIRFLDKHKEKLTDFNVFLPLIAMNVDDLTMKILDAQSRVEDKAALLAQLIVEGVQNTAFAKGMLDSIFKETGKESAEQISWINICTTCTFQPYLAIGLCLIQNEHVDERLGNMIKILCEYLTSQSEYPNDPNKLAILIPAFTTCIEYCVRSSRPKSFVSKLVKRRAVLRGKVAQSSLPDFCLSDDTIKYLIAMEDSESLICEQVKLRVRTFSASQYESANISVRKAILTGRVNIDRIVSVDDIDTALLELDYLQKMEISVQQDEVLLQIVQLNCEGSKVKRLVEYGCKLVGYTFVKHCINDIQEICGKIEDSSDPKDSTFSGVKKFKFINERNYQAVLQVLLNDVEENIFQVYNLLKTLRRYQANFYNYTNHITSRVIEVAKILTSMCRIALEGASWEKIQNVLLLFYQSAILFIRLVIKGDSKQLDENLVRVISSELTKAIYLLIPVAHQLDHEKMKSIYELGKGLGKKEKDADKRLKQASKWDSKIAREASRLPRLIFLIETFDCLVVKMSTWQPDLAKNLYKSTARDFRINLEQVEAALVESEESGIESGPETAV